ncbi:NUDIX domain-containing protein [Candidatus Roizmanbacteria bacterium]|nr:NUDIX domain-containing protein [Candidatus Roizmanbacteria bacterium]
MNIKSVLLNRIEKLAKKSYVDREVLNECRDALEYNKGLIKKDNISHHFCCFLVPLYLPAKSIFLVHHIKAKSWIPPGGHIDPDETPESTVKREFQEELDYSLTDEKVSLFDVSIARIEDSRTCVIHYDLWYTILCKEETRFIIEKKEFHDAGWFPIDEAIKKVSFERIRTVLNKIKKLTLSSPV